ncbi:MAG: bifunctional 4-hydroxy-2-oxoglutarate aldolase/2-dehydro-3-deoxy-phosphogluconate aldolase [Haliea sp.]|nr:bifunctional 4-hydroxy-2-oxoglutarate aldolase/2-dehydro-3-deoxy-phosphogluconate aldolase [Haliea sp.]
MSIEAILGDHRIVPVLAFKSVDEALAVSRALVESGIVLLEITLRTPVALDCIRAVAAALPDARVGVGTIVDPAQVAAARGRSRVWCRQALRPDLAAAVRECDLPFLPGVATVSEALAARALGFRTLKFFPAHASGGASFLASLQDVLPDLGFCPTGGINQTNAGDYLRLGNVRAIGGSWMVRRDANGGIDLEQTRAAAEGLPHTTRVTDHCRRNCSSACITPRNSARPLSLPP